MLSFHFVTEQQAPLTFAVSHLLGLLRLLYALLAQFRILYTMQSTLVLDSIGLLCLLVVCTTYNMLCFRSKAQERKQKHNMQRNIKVSKMLLIVIGDI